MGELFNMKILYTQCGKEIKIDDEDFDYLSKRKWYYTVGAARMWINKNDSYTGPTLMHRVIMNCNERIIFVDHINGDRLDNRKSNLRICSRIENNRNGKIRKNNTCGYKGVSPVKSGKKFVAQISVNYKKIHLGHFNTAIEAHKAYTDAAIKYHREYANDGVSAMAHKFK